MLSPDLLVVLVVITVVGIVVVVAGVVVANLFREVQAGAVLLGRRSAASTSVSKSVIQHLSVPVPTHLPGIQNLSIPVPTHLLVDCFAVIAMSMPPLERVWGPERCPRCACSHAWVVVVIEVVVGVVDVVVVIVVGVVIAVSLVVVVVEVVDGGGEKRGCAVSCLAVPLRVVGVCTRVAPCVAAIARTASSAAVGVCMTFVGYVRKRDASAAVP